MTSVDEQKQAMMQPPTIPSDPYAVAYLQLCEISYFEPSSIPFAVSRMPGILGIGSWKCIWGPAQTSDLANLVFVAAYSQAPGMPPTLAAVVTRGTDVDVKDIWGVLVQLYEDLHVTSLVPLPWAPTNPARVAAGTIQGLAAIQNLLSGGKTLLEFLGDYLSSPANGNPVLVPTGHSLGGCLTSVIAPWLQAALASKCPNLQIVPATFAAPTAGNADFAKYFDSMFKFAMRVFNTLDIAPLAWGDIAGVGNIYYGPCVILTPVAVVGVAIGFEIAVGGLHYTQPKAVVPLKGSCSGSTDFYSEAAYQHHATTYMALLGGTSIIGPPALVTPAPKPRRPPLPEEGAAMEEFVKRWRAARPPA